MFIAVGIFSALGVPLMGLAMGNFTRILLKFGGPEEAKKVIQEKVTDEELDMMRKFGLGDGTELFTKTDFVILSLMRLRVLTPSTIHEINDRFNSLDIARCGYLNIDSIVSQSRNRSISHYFGNSIPRTQRGNNRGHPETS